MLKNKLLSAMGGEATDPDFENVTMLLHGDGTNGGQNNTFLDASTNNFTITRNGNTTQGSFSPYGPNWSNFFNGSNAYLTTPSNAAFEFGTANFTIEFWVYLNAYTSVAAHIIGPHTQNVGADWWVVMTDTGQVVFNIGNGSPSNPRSTGNVSTNTWTHVAIVKNSGVYAFYLNGSASGTSANTDFISCNRTIGIGAPNNGGLYFTNGYISNLRVVKGTAVYTSAFIPSTTPLTAVSGTSLLTCADNRFVDDSTNNFALTINGTPSVQRFSPFVIANPGYTTATIGGSGYFDGAGDYLAAPNNAAFAFGAGAFTIEAWVYPTATKSIENAIFDSLPISGIGGRSNAMLFSINPSNRLQIFNAGSAFITSPDPVPLNCWTYVAATSDGSTVRLFVNGALVATVSRTMALTDNSCSIGVTADIPGNTNGNFQGYITGERIVKGTALYTSSFTVPTAPISTVSGTSLLLNFTNAAIFDNAMMNNLETVGNAQISTSVKKFGTGSMAFDGSGDYIVEPTNLNFGYGTGNFTIEFWLYLNSTGLQTVVSNLSSGSSTNPHIYISTTIRYYTAGADRITGATLSTGQWYHIALCRASGSTRLFVDGTQSGSTYSDANNYGASAPLGIGTYWEGTPSASNTLNGYIDDLRITKGVARYTANFTPPTSALPTK
jgi:hypothetical protein